jgi:hypothetical protein
LRDGCLSELRRSARSCETRSPGFRPSEGAISNTLPSLSMERTTSFSVRNFLRTVSMGGIDQTHRSAAKSEARKCIIKSPSGSSPSGLTTDVSRGPARKLDLQWQNAGFHLLVSSAGQARSSAQTRCRSPARARPRHHWWGCRGQLDHPRSIGLSASPWGRPD